MMTKQLQQLEERVRKELELLHYPAGEWMLETSCGDQPVIDVLIVGGGQGGLAAAFGLKQAKVNNFMVVDAQPSGLEGPWNRFARMKTLRTPKHVTGPDMGVPSLTPRAWYEAKYGEQAWDDLKKWPIDDWHAYLQWFRDVVEIPVENNTSVTSIQPTGEANDPLAVTLETAHEQKRVLARKVILATGIEASGRWFIPEFISSGIGPNFYSHTSEDIDFEALRGRRIAVLGAGASAFDNAAVALEKGAESVDLFVRREKIPVKNPYRWMERAGFLAGFNAMADPMKWAFAHYIFTLNQPPPQETYSRCAEHKNFDVHLSAPWNSVRQVGDRVEVTTPQGSYEVDHLIIGTGFIMDFAARPELSCFAENIVTWGDRYEPLAGLKSQVLSSYPYLGSGFEFQEKEAGKTPWIRNVHNFTFGSFPSMGLTGSSISGMKYGARILTDKVVADLWAQDAERQLQALKDFDGVELVDARLSRHGPL